ncbi:hypothetical protein EUTSA_v10000538mg [Eutrema salsugineum]|uniref:DUF4283 domain-containing protein n=1 Tax=Eutrema salsugineum TaxID=72664 RepID=V4NJZ2_EUTSA|nr:hypothetical protein EUTSA_v10000538mg [Eutrema salsugineum]
MKNPSRLSLPIDCVARQSSPDSMGSPPATVVTQSQPPSPNNPPLSSYLPRDLYASVIRDPSGSIKPDFVLTNGIAQITIPKEIVADAMPLWKNFVVGYFMGDAPHVGSIHATVNRIWSSSDRASKIDVQFINRSTVLFRIDNANSRERVLRRKYWYIANTPLVVDEWTPESAHKAPDLSAMPLWVDFRGVPGYLYSHAGLKFLSRTTGEFVKLHPNTEKCLRMDVARALVEVDMQKPLTEKICFTSDQGEEITVDVFYPWLPPRCGSCHIWGHEEKACPTLNHRTILTRKKRLRRPLRNRSRIGSRRLVIQDKGKTQNLNLEESIKVGENEREISEEWREVKHLGKKSSPTRQDNAKGVNPISPNGFDALSNIREEGEIDETQETEVSVDGEGGHEGLVENASDTEKGGKTDLGVQNIKLKRCKSAHRSRSRGPQKPAESRMNAGTHHQPKKTSSRKL